MRDLSPSEKQRLKILTRKSISFCLLEPTETALEKSILDATHTVRDYLYSEGVHDYESQGQGPGDKVLIKGRIITGEAIHWQNVSFYRPNSKDGDPRLWIYGLKHYASSKDIIVLTHYSGNLYCFNITQLPIEELIYSDTSNPLKEFIEEVEKDKQSVAEELLAKLKDIANQGFIPSQVDGDTAVGRTLHRLLGIQMNSSIQPDFKSIELQSHREGKRNRKNLFAKVPNWDLSKVNSSEEILNYFGYKRDGERKLNCTVKTTKRNPQGLQLEVNDSKGWLIENSEDPSLGDFAVWEFDTLHKRLLMKHKETFWIQAESKNIDGVEHFRYTEVEHTREPIVPQFKVLIKEGGITVDHLIKRNPTGTVREKGPLFKIHPDSLDLLFPPSHQYDLL